MKLRTRHLRRFVSALLLLSGTVFGQEPSAKLREILSEIASDPRFKDPHQYAEALGPTAEMKTRVLAESLVPDLNYIYGWNLPADGGWPPARVNDIVYEIVLSSRYNAKAFLRALRPGGTLLREVRRRGCLDRFNERYHLSIPANGGLSFKQAEVLLYSIVSRPGFDAERLLADLCPTVGTSPLSEAVPPRPSPPGSRDSIQKKVDQQNAPVGKDSRRLKALSFIVTGGLLSLVMITLLVRSILSDRGKL